MECTRKTAQNRHNLYKNLHGRGFAWAAGLSLSAVAIIEINPVSANVFLALLGFRKITSRYGKAY
jgi:hypothetical protein